MFDSARRLSLLVALSLLPIARGQDAASMPVIKADDNDALTANVDRDAIVTGKIASAAWSPTGKVMQIRFDGVGRDGFAAVVFEKGRKTFDESYGGDAAKTLSGATVRLRGKLRIYKEHVEMTLDRPDQITIETAATSQPSS
jgi:DNA/RNA endonuclease YhcR with UshA esterase domain